MRLEDRVTGPELDSEVMLKEDGAAPAEQSAPPAPTKMKRSTRVALAVIAVIAVIAAMGFAGTYFFYSRNYVSTSNAQVDGDKISINAPITGTLTNWTINTGSKVYTNRVVGRIQLMGSFQPQRTIKAPGNGTVAVNNAVNGSYVTAGMTLATAYDFEKIYLTARVDETDIGDVRTGAAVDFTVDAFPGVSMTGIVEAVQGSSAGQFSLFPQNNSSGNFQKVTQVIPVKIALTDTGGQQLVPGENATVHIHKH
jgi:multidrug resistance efflux pump